jgi:hypothetical protein
MKKKTKTAKAAKRTNAKTKTIPKGKAKAAGAK